MSETSEYLTFESDRGAGRSTWIAAAILVAVVAWMGSGFILPASDEEADDARPTTEIEPVSVAVRTSVAKEVTLFFQAEGQAQPDRDTSIRAETTGDVADVLVKKGDDVEEGQIIARIATERAEADLSRAEAELDRARRDYDNATELLSRGVATQDRVSDTRAVLASAEAQLVTAQDALESTNITAPFAGRIETLSLDEGEFISAGSDVGRIVDNRPLTVSLQVPQQTLNQIQNGQVAEVRFITGEVRSGTVTFVGTSASAETRTFLAEIEVSNQDGAIPAGISAEIIIPTGQQMAHFVAPSIISLNERGVPGVKAVVDRVVVFHEIDVVRAEVDGVWVIGIPDSAELITIGQGYVRDGEMVRAMPDSRAIAEASSTAEVAE